MEQNRTEQNRVEQNGMEQMGTHRNRPEQNETEPENRVGRRMTNQVWKKGTMPDKERN